jgi:AcrR family transcriptional regulator
MNVNTTKDGVFEAAELAFGECGFTGASLRQITDKAGVNLAAVNYHFRSKEDLYRQVLLRRLRPINAERITRLAQAEQLAGDQPVPLRAILDAFIRPMLRNAGEPASGGASCLRLLSRETIDPQPFLREELARESEAVTNRYAQALGQALPGVPPHESSWRLQFALGALLLVAARWQELDRLASGPGSAHDVEDRIRRLVGFCAAGFDALRASV